jgi:hypothetical protein
MADASRTRRGALSRSRRDCRARRRAVKVGPSAPPAAAADAAPLTARRSRAVLRRSRDRESPREPNRGMLSSSHVLTPTRRGGLAAWPARRLLRQRWHPVCHPVSRVDELDPVRDASACRLAGRTTTPPAEQGRQAFGSLTVIETPKASATRSVSASRTVGFPRSSSPRNRRPTPAASARSSSRKPRAVLAALRAAPSSPGVVIGTGTDMFPIGNITSPRAGEFLNVPVREPGPRCGG